MASEITTTSTPPSLEAQRPIKTPLTAQVMCFKSCKTSFMQEFSPILDLLSASLDSVHRRYRQRSLLGQKKTTAYGEIFGISSRERK
ncbi:hypothetical protein Nepgr_007706 [Nepenthes gracilis]|uniref:Uncharacterized protein n=1 Tax=Nepenthes gracilis TaxID=150966 RepID=A0AAD3XIS1_NEPGR|nr:hypothetical protein Nepgr_007706 [Nepenthes gracilis]